MVCIVMWKGEDWDQTAFWFKDAATAAPYQPSQCVTANTCVLCSDCFTGIRVEECFFTWIRPTGCVCFNFSLYVYNSKLKWLKCK